MPDDPSHATSSGLVRRQGTRPRPGGASPRDPASPTTPRGQRARSSMASMSSRSCARGRTAFIHDLWTSLRQLIDAKVPRAQGAGRVIPATRTRAWPTPRPAATCASSVLEDEATTGRPHASSHLGHGRVAEAQMTALRSPARGGSAHHCSTAMRAARRCKSAAGDDVAAAVTRACVGGARGHRLPRSGRIPALGRRGRLLAGASAAAGPATTATAPRRRPGPIESGRRTQSRFRGQSPRASRSHAAPTASEPHDRSLRHVSRSWVSAR